MTFPIKKSFLSPLAQNYAQLKKQSVGRTPDEAKNMLEESNSSMSEDTVTLSSGQSDNRNLLKLGRSQPVTPVEKQALQFQFSLYA